MNVSNKEVLLHEVDRLIDLELYESAESLASLFVSHLTTVEFKPKVSNEPVAVIFADVLEKIGDALVKKTEHKRALQYYRSALHRRRSQQTKFRGGQGISTAEEARIRYKECRCQMELRETANVVRDLEVIPPHLRDARMHTLLAQLYKSSNRKRQAVQAYKDALLGAPLAIEIIEQLVSLGLEASEVLATLDEALRHKDAGALTTDGWLHTMVSALVAKRNHDHEKSLSGFQKLSSHFPKNAFLLTQQTAVCVESEQTDQAIVLFRQIRREEPCLVHRTAAFGRLLALKEDAVELARLTDDVLEAQNRRPEGWLLAATYAQLKGELDSALALLDKAVAVDPQCGDAYRLRGQIYMSQENHSAALIAFSQASGIDKDVASFAGLVTGNLAVSKLKEATICAREALSLFPRSSEAYLLMGSVFAVTPNATGECLSAYAKALQLNPLSKAAALGMAEVLIAAGKAQEAVNCLEGILKKVSDPKLRLALGKAYTATGEYSSSVNQLHSAMSLGTASTGGSTAELNGETEAAQELERVEGLMRGEADALVEEEEEEGEYEDAMQGDGGDELQHGYSGHSLIDEDAELEANITLSQYYQAAGLMDPDESHSLNPRDFTAYADEEAEEEHEMGYYQDEEHSGDGADHLVYGTLDDSADS